MAVRACLPMVLCENLGPQSDRLKGDGNLRCWSLVQSNSVAGALLSEGTGASLNSSHRRAVRTTNKQAKTKKETQNKTGSVLSDFLSLSQ